jgi:hypothetical protein
MPFTKPYILVTMLEALENAMKLVSNKKVRSYCFSSRIVKNLTQVRRHSYAIFFSVQPARKWRAQETRDTDAHVTPQACASILFSHC